MENNWSQEQMLQVTLKEPDDFLKVRETLSRIGVASRKERKLYQSCHILHKQGKYYIVHFKELFALDGKETNLSENDIARRNTIAKLLNDWNLVGVEGKIEPVAPLSQIKILSFKEKDEWTLETKYNIGKKKEEEKMSTILDALKKKYEAEIEEGKVNIKIMLNNPISIPEHSKFLEEFDVHFGKIAEAEDKLGSLFKNHFDSSQELLNEDVQMQFKL